MTHSNFNSDNKKSLLEIEKNISKPQNLEATTINIERYLSKMFLPLFALIIAFTFMFSNEAFALPGTGVGAATIDCETCNCNTAVQCICVTNGKTTVYGHAKRAVFDVSGLIDNNGAYPVGELATADIFIPDSDTEDEEDGWGYINIPVFYDEIGNRNIYIIDKAIEFTNYAEWLDALNFVKKQENYIGNKVLVYPNPTNSSAFVKLNDDLSSIYDIESVKVDLYYGNNSTLIKTYIPERFDSLIPIDANCLQNSGAYYIMCTIYYYNLEGVIEADITTIPLMVTTNN